MEPLNLGLIHRIGDGSSINVWNDRWIPSTRTMTPTVKPRGATVMNVSELLNLESGTWRVELVRANFAATDATAIVNIPLRRGGGVDILAWAHEKSGNYTVKSAYRALMTHKEQSAQVEGQVSDASVAQTHLWKLLWALKVVPKSIKYTRGALALLEIPKAQAATLPGYGWQPPEGNQVKINTDVAVDILRQQCAAGGVAQSRSSLLGAWAKPHAGVTDPLIAETLALREGVIFASLRGFPDAVMETDCQEVVNLSHDRRDGRSVVAAILFEIEELSLTFSSFVIQHVLRAANGPAHLCAKHACTRNATESWLTETPSFLVSSLVDSLPSEHLSSIKL
ncbi:Casein kinase I-2-like protein [Hordeum vulgare]|nr:Casein kinase I-2-like protein [Hordeum vulgare]